MKPAYNFIIRSVTIEDIGVLQWLSIYTFTDTYAVHNTAEDMQLYIARKFNRETLLHELEDTANYFFMALLDNAPAGYIKLRTTEQPAALQGRKHIELERIYALKQFQGTGLGKLLIQKCVSTALLNGYEVLWLGVWKQNKKAIQFYTKCGFSIFGEQIFTLGSDSQTDWLMKKELYA